MKSATSVRFTVAAHIMAALGFRHGEELPSAMLAESVNADPTSLAVTLVVEKRWKTTSKLALALHRNCLILHGKLPLTQIAIKVL